MTRTKKPQLNADFLARHGITYYEDGDEARADLPEHVRGVKEKLLNFQRFPRSFKTHFDSNLEALREAGWRRFVELWDCGEDGLPALISLQPQHEMYCDASGELDLPVSIESTQKKAFSKSKRVARDAYKLAKSAEPAWMDLYTAEVFKTYTRSADDPSTDLRKMVERWSL
ncbi:hypothetical protein K431DRAFT_80091 [Polychaeton citri CBS 116435]|uniref:Uncharacterized protein n=1 Tax=Polychaeton citri CBS 116435 TaxID=1314669 RepID=A0A9P4UU98_9PEZI|nr:hypothetical protein K431DRAFT_80091 [Polychaeton citri CBS 116435]